MSKEIVLTFSKMHGLGNDYLVIDESKKEIIPEAKKPALIEELCRRGFSVGADGVIFVAPSQKADVQFRIFNSDGSEAEMCGNGIRCFGKYVYESGILPQHNMSIETSGGVKKLQLKVEDEEVRSIKVDMGTASFQTKDVPMITDKEEFLDGELMVGWEPLQMTVLSVGNPHAVIFTEDLSEIPLEALGPKIENHEAFPRKINAHFVDIMSRDEIEMITWERGVGITLACGTGATSCVLAGFRLGLLDENVLVHLPGGELRIKVYPDGKNLGAFMEGDSVLVFEGTMKIEV